MPACFYVAAILLLTVFCPADAKRASELNSARHVNRVTTIFIRLILMFTAT